MFTVITIEKSRTPVVVTSLHRFTVNSVMHVITIPFTLYMRSNDLEKKIIFNKRFNLILIFRGKVGNTPLTKKKCGYSVPLFVNWVTNSHFCKKIYSVSRAGQEVLILSDIARCQMQFLGRITYAISWRVLKNTFSRSIGQSWAGFTFIIGLSIPPLPPPRIE
jgi:hypothetical protein